MNRSGLLILLIVGLNGCSAPGSPNAEIGACEAAIAEAAAIDASADTVTDLDRAIEACESVEEFGTTAEAFPDALDGVSAATFLTNRCQFEPSLAAAPICEELGASATTAPANAAQEFVDYFAERSGLLRVTLEQMQSDAVSGDLFALGTSAQQLAILAQQEAEWLDTHPPMDCYAAVHASARVAYVHLAAAGVAIRAAADAGDPNAATIADADLISGSEALAAASAEVANLPAACDL